VLLVINASFFEEILSVPHTCTCNELSLVMCRLVIHITQCETAAGQLWLPLKHYSISQKSTLSIYCRRKIYDSLINTNSPRKIFPDITYLFLSIYSRLFAKALQSTVITMIFNNI
jgi:hypothetical protein